MRINDILILFCFSASRVQLPAQGASVPPGDQALLAEPQVSAGHASTTLSEPRGKTLLPHRHAPAQNSLCADTALLLAAGKLFIG